MHIGHRGRFRGRNGTFRLRKLGIELALECFAALLGFGVQAVAGLIRNRLRIAVMAPSELSLVPTLTVGSTLRPS